MPNAVATKTSTVTKDGAHINQDNYITHTKQSTFMDCNKASGITMARCFITPEMAQNMLNTMGINRTFKSVREAKYTAELANGRWKESPQPIIFNTEGCLIDGQHRLMSVIKSNTPAIFWVATNVPSDTPIDVGLPRSSADSLRCRGKITEEMARNNSMALVNALFRLKGCTPGAVSDEDRAILLNGYEKEIQLALSIASTGSSSAITRKAGCTVAIFSAILNGVAIDQLYDFAECVNSGEISHEQRGALMLRNYLTQGYKRGNPNEVASITEQAIFDFMRNHPRKQAYKKGNFPYSENFRLEDLLK